MSEEANKAVQDAIVRIMSNDPTMTIAVFKGKCIEHGDSAVVFVLKCQRQMTCLSTTMSDASSVLILL
jgi:hypothetical protein